MLASLWSLEPITGELKSSPGCFNFGVFDDDDGAVKGAVILFMIISWPSKDPKNEEEKHSTPAWGQPALTNQVAQTVTANLGVGLTLHKWLE